MKRQKGFTLIELLVVIGILVVLLAIVLIAINPGRQFSQAGDTKRRSDVNAILNAIGGFAADNKGARPSGIPVGVQADAVNVGTTSICDAIMSDYISAVPVDPDLNNDAGIIDCTGNPATGYTVVQDSSGRVTVFAPSTKIGPVISVTR